MQEIFILLFGYSVYTIEDVLRLYMWIYLLYLIVCSFVQIRRPVLSIKAVLMLFDMSIY